jgi:hypothetical protein
MVGISFRLAASYADPREIRRIAAASLSVTTRRAGGVVSSLLCIELSITKKDST